MRKSTEGIEYSIEDNEISDEKIFKEKLNWNFC